MLEKESPPPSEYEFSYEVKSKQIRRYKVNSAQSVRRAISSNIQDYFAFQGICEDQLPWWSIAPNAIIIFMAFIICLQRSYGSLNTTLLYEIIVFYILLGLKYIWDTMFVLSDMIFEGTGTVNVKEHSKPFARTLCSTKKKLRVFLQYTEKHNAMILRMELVENGAFPTTAKLLFGVEKRILYCRYFNSQGFFYPVNMVKDVDQLLNRLLERYLS